MANLIMFCILAVVILSFAIMCVLTRRIMRAVTFLISVLPSVTSIYSPLGYIYLGTARIVIYAGGTMILYTSTIQLVSKCTLQGLVEYLKDLRVVQGALLSLIGLAAVVGALVKNQFIHQVAQVADAEVPMGVIGQALVDSEKYQYALLFELVSVFLLVCITGSLLTAGKEDDRWYPLNV